MSQEAIDAVASQASAVSMGGFANAFAVRNKRTVRGPINPLDKCTIFSIYNKEIFERKATIQPGSFLIPAGTYENPARLVVGPSSWWREIDDEQPLIEIPTGAMSIAQSIVQDYVIGLLARTPDAAPGLFWVPGDISVKELKTDEKYKKLLDKANKMQEEWFKLLVKLGDIGWARTNGNPLCISDDMRMAAHALRVSENKDWMQDFKMFETIACIACGRPRNPKFPVCPSCNNIIDPELFAKSGIVKQLKSSDASQIDFGLGK